MASEVTSDRRVIAPLNLSAPAPILGLRGFKWDAVDEKIHGTQRREEAALPSLTSSAPARAPQQQPAALERYITATPLYQRH